MTDSKTLRPRPPVVRTIGEIRERVLQARVAGRRVGVVPTMGALHAGHLSLVEAANRECDFSVVTIFVNPAQFAPHEDFAKYPRALEADLEKLATVGADAVFAPCNEEMYPQGFSTYVDPPKVAERLEGVCRPGHFRGVATVVLKLFLAAPADAAFFGHKDYQQSLVIRRMVEDLNVPIEIRVMPTVREPDGLAMSSRNSYLSSEERQRALSLSRSLRLIEQLTEQGERDAIVLRRQMLDALRGDGLERVDYATIVHPETLAESDHLDGPAIALIAAYVGKTRLIDNCRLLDGGFSQVATAP
jgi:pantoate--beta-alanine ligase